jgi:mRNA interferase RelE/StbE
MKLRRSKSFQKQYARLPKAVRQKVKRQLIYLATDARHPSLRSRKMVNQPDIYEARIDRHYRLTFTVHPDLIILRRVGTHTIYRQP